jgi:hypothetical protein
MTDLPPHEGHDPLRDTGVQPRSDSPQHDPLQSPWRGEWGHDVGNVPQVERPVERERLFSRKVIIGWAAATLILYFAAHMIRTTIKQSIGESVRASRAAAAHAGRPGSRPGRVVIMLPNGKRITIDQNGAEVSLPGESPAPAAPTAQPAPAATPAVAGSKAPDLPPPVQKKH